MLSTSRRTDVACIIHEQRFCEVQVLLPCAYSVCCSVYE